MKTFSENIVLPIGMDSSGGKFMVNLEKLPHLFISYNNEAEITQTFTTMIRAVLECNVPAQLSLSVSSRLAEYIDPWITSDVIFMKFTHRENGEAMIYSVDEFIGALLKELKTRKAIYKKPSSMNLILPMIIFIDNIFEVIMSPNKKSVLSLIELLITGATVEMYFIMGSPGIYRALLDQLINVTPSLKKKLNKSVQEKDISQPLGAELVINPDGLLFFRRRNEKVHVRLFPCCV